MASVLRFPGLRYDPGRIPDPSEVLADAASWPAHATSASARTAGRAGAPDSLEATRAPQGPALRPGQATGSGAYHAARLFGDWAGAVAGDWLRARVLVQDPSPVLYLYRREGPLPPEILRLPGIPESVDTLGVLAAVQLEGEGRPRPVEVVDQEAVTRMVPVMKAFAYDVAPVWGLVAAPPAQAGAKALQSLLDRAMASPPLWSVGRDGGARHTLWGLSEEDSAALAELLAQRPLAIAGGWVQAAASARGPILAFLTVADAAARGAPVAVPIHRLLLSPAALPRRKAHLEAGAGGWDAGTARTLVERLSMFFRVTDEPISPGATPIDTVSAALAKLHRMRAEFNGFVLYTGGGQVRLARTKGRMFMECWTHPVGRSAWRALDVNVLHAMVFEHMLGIYPERSRTNKPPVATEPALEAAIRRVDDGEAIAAFILAPPALDQLLAAALDNNPIPADSVRPWPPVPAGLALRRRRNGPP